MNSTNFPDFSCPVYKRGDSDYDQHCYQYATTSQPIMMSPAAIICPQGENPDEDIIKAIKYAAANNLSIAVRTGGHAYSGTSSTSGSNIQIDLSAAYNDWNYDARTGVLRVGISYSLLEFNAKLRELGLFMPTGQCYNVHLGGHIQTGGYGQLSRAFGLFSDHIESFEIILADGSKKEVKPGEDLFFAVLGGGPGNYGIVTHVTIRPLKDSDYSGSRAYKHVIPYDPKYDHNVLVQLFDLVKEWENAPSDYDFCFTVASAEKEFLVNLIGLASAEDFFLTFWGGKNGSPPFNTLLVYFQYSNTDKGTPYNPTWCNKIKNIVNSANTQGPLLECIKMKAEEFILNLLVTHQDDKPTPISTSVNELWTYLGTREFNYPYIKNGQDTDVVASEDWSEWAATRIDMMTGRSEEGLMVFVQCQNFGGKNSTIVKNGKRNETAYSWRDTTVGYNLDVFYDPKQPPNQFGKTAYDYAREWHETNIAEGIGANGKFSQEDHRWFWASYGNLNMKDVWPYYYSSPEIYAKCCRVKKQVDPNGIFTPNSFVVGYDVGTTVAATPSDISKFDDAVYADITKQRAREKGLM